MPWGNNSDNGNNNNNGGKKSPWGSGPSKPSGTGNKPENNKPSNQQNKPGGQNFGGFIDIEKFFKEPKKPNDINISPKAIIGFGALAVILWVFSGIYQVGPEQQGVVLRFGKFTRSAEAGLNIHLPYPIEQVIKVPVTKVNSVEVGFRSGGNTSSRSRGNETTRETKVLAESLMITGDTNIADVSFEVQWRINDAEKFLFNVREPEPTVKALSESAMREVIGRTPFEVAMGEGRQQIEDEAKAIIQSGLDSYDAGVEIIMLQLRPVQNPGPVMDAFLDVETAKQDKETAINRGKAYANDIIPRARGDAERIIQESEAYKGQVIAVANGEAQRFASVLKEYNMAKDVTKKRLYLETMQEILAGTNKIIIDDKGKGAGVLPYLPLGELNRKETTKIIDDK
jgi:membrane protease subunit HflK